MESVGGCLCRDECNHLENILNFKFLFNQRKIFLCSINGFRIDRDDNQENNENKLGIKGLNLNFINCLLIYTNQVFFKIFTKCLFMQ